MMLEMSLGLPVLAGLAGLLLGAGVVRLFARRAAERDAVVDSDSGAELARLREAVSQADRELRAASARAERQGAELERTRDHIRTLEEQVAAYLRQYAQAKDRLKKEIMQNGALRAELAATEAEAAALRARVDELTMDRGPAAPTRRREAG